MPEHERKRRPLLFGERHVLDRQGADHIAVEGDVIGDPKTMENREQQQRIVGRLFERLRPLEQQAGSYVRDVKTKAS